MELRSLIHRGIDPSTEGMWSLMTEVLCRKKAYLDPAGLRVRVVERLIRLRCLLKDMSSPVANWLTAVCIWFASFSSRSARP